MDRRVFLRNTAIGMGTMAKIGVNGLKAEELKANAPAKPGAKATWGDGIGRPVRVASIGFKGGCVPLERMASLVDERGLGARMLFCCPNCLAAWTMQARSRCTARPSPR